MSGHVKTKDELLKLLLANRSDIEKFGTRRLGLFGSFARDEQKKTSDVDFLVEFREGQKNYDNFIGLASLLESLLNRKVELLTKESLSAYIGPNILKEAEYVIDSE
ncbi:nucleotidyltransferase family protein [Patescibacteria group bacterium]|nr:nucleotidyltransferase family protein [Nanoarchaeota archaeon]MBU1016045.1 nucleotidyltransferase family protein [Patescibacteria group bacterium]MBU1623372.1 nucleotidyltransferase family protein [Nanoarchaeota archaeon]